MNTSDRQSAAWRRTCGRTFIGAPGFLLLLGTMESSRRIFSWPDRERLRAYFIWMGLVMTVFISVYGFCNNSAARSAHLYRMYFDWELGIPFIPAMIIPYRTIEVMMVAVFFVLDKREMKAYCLALL